MTNNFGGVDEEVHSRQSTNAYMLVYVRKSQLKEILCEVSDADMPAGKRKLGKTAEAIENVFISFSNHTCYYQVKIHLRTFF